MQNRILRYISIRYRVDRLPVQIQCIPLLNVWSEAGVMNSTVDEISVEYEESGQILVKEVDKVILSKGLWATILFRYQELMPETGEYGPDKYTIRRYQKVGGEYRQKSKFNISSAEQARKIVDALSSWIDAC